MSTPRTRFPLAVEWAELDRQPRIRPPKEMRWATGNASDGRRNGLHLARRAVGPVALCGDVAPLTPTDPPRGVFMCARCAEIAEVPVSVDESQDQKATDPIHPDTARVVRAYRKAYTAQEALHGTPTSYKAAKGLEEAAISDLLNKMIIQKHPKDCSYDHKGYPAVSP